MANTNLANAKTAKNDEFYTQYADIQKEINAYLEYNPDVFRGKTVLLPCDDPEWSNFTKFFAQNFELFGLKKLISTSYAVESKKIKDWQPTLFEKESPYYDADKSRTNGKIFVLDEDINNDGRFNINDLHWNYLEGDGDFRSDEVKALRDEADIIITNPPFSLFREFMMWIIEANKQFVVIGNQNAVSYKEIFPLIRENKIWLGVGFKGGATHFISNYQDIATAPKIGPNRSARHNYVEVAAGLDAIYVHFGGSYAAYNLFSKDSSIDHIDGSKADGSAFKRDKSRGVATEHTAYTTGEWLSARIANTLLY